jgi:hypothetical protein
VLVPMWEPRLLFRKPLDGCVQDNLREALPKLAQPNPR